MKYSSKLISFIVSIIWSLVSFWWRALFLGISSYDNPLSFLTIRRNLIFSFTLLDFFPIISLYYSLTTMKSPISNPSLFLWIFSVISKYGSIIPPIKCDNTLLYKMDPPGILFSSLYEVKTLFMQFLHLMTMLGGRSLVLTWETPQYHIYHISVRPFTHWLPSFIPILRIFKYVYQIMRCASHGWHG